MAKIIAVLALAAGPAWAEAPKVAVSIAPVHSLVAAVMAEVTEPVLLVDPRQSQHTFQLKPSGARALAEARLVVWLGPGAEPSLERPIAALPAQARVLTVTAFRGLTLLDRRRGADWEGEHGRVHRHGAGAGDSDPHVWLDADNARLIVDVVRDALVELDPANAYFYTRNAARTGNAIRDLDRALRRQLSPLHGRRYLVFHDGYQYFERRYGLSPAGAIALAPEVAPGAKRIAALRARIRAGDIVCVFGEPQFSPAVLATVTEGLGVRGGTLDYLGAGHPPGPALWFETMRGLADALVGCLS